MLKRRVVALLMIFSLLSLPVAAQNGGGDMLSRIRKEAMERSQIMKTMHMFTDVYGPRLTGSPNHKAAAEWAVKQMTAWGFDNAHLEPWDFKHPGWANERLTAHLISPVKDPLVCEVLAWTPSTKGTVQAKAYQLVLPERPSQEQLKLFFSNQQIESARENRTGRQTGVDTCQSESRRQKGHSDEQAQNAMDQTRVHLLFRRLRQLRRLRPNAPRPLSNRQVAQQLDAFLKDNGALVRVNDAGREFRQIRAFNNNTFDVNKVIPTVVMSNEDFGRITRILNDGTEVDARIQHRQPHLSRRTHFIQHDRRDSWHRQSRRSDHARRPSRLVACGNRRD